MAPSRREFLRAGGLGLLGLNLPTMIEARALSAPVAPPSSFGRAKACILLFMWGGPAQQETWDLKPDAPDNVRGEFRPISTNVPGLDIGEHAFFQSGGCRTIEAAGQAVVGLPRDGAPHRTFGNASSPSRPAIPCTSALPKSGSHRNRE